MAHATLTLYDIEDGKVRFDPPVITTTEAEQHEDLTNALKLVLAIDQLITGDPDMIPDLVEKRIARLRIEADAYDRQVQAGHVIVDEDGEPIGVTDGYVAPTPASNVVSFP